jgi:hypothetical protein
MKKNYLSKINVSLLIFISLFCFANKWLLSFIFLPNEDLSFKLISDSHQDSAMYFHYIKSLINFNFSNTFSPISSGNGFLIVPFGSIIFHALGLKFFGIGSFILFEFLSILIFLTIFFLIFKELKISNNYSVTLSTLIFFLPFILEKISFFNFDEINTFINNFYNLRFPRPLIANLYFFTFIYLLIISTSKNIFEKKYLISLSVILSLSFSSFFFIFINQILCFFLLLILRYKYQLLKLLKIYSKNILIASFVFFLVSAPFIILVLNSNNDYNERLGINIINFEEKIFLLEHYFEKLFRLKAILLYLIILFLYISYKKNFRENLEILNIFLIVFISSILSPILFILISSKVSFLYHFNNIIIVSIILLLVMFVITFTLQIIKKYNLVVENKILPISLTLILLFFFNINFYFEYEKNINNNKKRLEKNEIVKIIKDNNKLNLTEAQMLTFDTQIMIWAILNDIKYLKIIDGTFTIKSNEIIENDLIESFKFLDLNKEKFISFIENKKIGYRYLNPNMRQLFWQKYQANSLFTFMKSEDFEKKTLEHIKNSSPFYAHQFAIPDFELNRLVTKYENLKENNNLNPEIILIDLDKDIINKYSINQINYCKAFSGNLYNLYFKKKYCE